MEATMYQSYRQGQTQQRDLYTTDIEGICAVYPPGGKVSSEECTPRHGLLRTCAVKESSGCTITSERANGAGSLGFVAALGLGLRLRRRQARRA